MEQKNILIIEDDPRVRKSIGEMFSESCKVEYAENYFRIISDVLPLVLPPKSGPPVSIGN